MAGGGGRGSAGGPCATNARESSRRARIFLAPPQAPKAPAARQAARRGRPRVAADAGEGPPPPQTRNSAGAIRSQIGPRARSPRCVSFWDSDSVSPRSHHRGLHPRQSHHAATTVTRPWARLESGNSPGVAQAAQIAFVFIMMQNAYMSKESAITVRVPAKLKQQLQDRARRAHRSLSAQVVVSLEQAVAAEAAPPRSASGGFLGKYASSRLPSEADFAQVRSMLWGSVGKDRNGRGA